MPNSQELSCQELVELLTDYLEGRLSPGEKARFEEHLTICEGCQTYLDHMRQTVRALGRLTEETIPPDARAELLQAFRQWKKG
jgi:anti-sigma factor RsiW